MKTIKHSRRGAALVISLIMAFLLLTISASFLTLSTSSRRINDANYSYHAMLPVAERGVDQAVKTLNKYVAINTPFWLAPANSAIYITSWGGDGVSADGWKGDPVSGFIKDFGSSLDLGDGRTASLKVKVLNIPTGPSPSKRPYCIAEVTYNSKKVFGSATYSRQFLVALATDSSRGTGMIAMNSISFSGNNVTIDGYNSSLGAYNFATNRNDQVTVATVKTDPGFGSISLGGGNIYGYIATGDNPNGADPTITYQKNGAHIWGADSDILLQISGQDLSRITNDFTLTTADFPMDTPPAVPTKTADNVITGSTTKLTTGTYIVDSKLSIKDDLVVSGNVVILVVDSSGKVASTSAPEIALTGNGSISVSSGSTLKIYTSGDVKLAGKGVVNSSANPPKSIYLSGVNSGSAGTQSIESVGNGSFTGVVYAPQSSVKLAGNGLIFGSITAYTITCVGNATFHYDVALSTTSEPSYYLNAFVELGNKDKVVMGF